MAETENSAPSESIKDEHDELPILNSDLISIPQLCEVFSAQHEAMTYGEACVIINSKFNKAPVFKVRMYVLKQYNLPIPIDGLSMSIWFGTFESEEEDEDVKDAMRSFTRGIFFTEWWKYEGRHYPCIEDFALSANEIGILKTDAPNFGVAMESIERYQRDKYSPLNMLGLPQTPSNDTPAKMPEQDSEETENQRLKRTLAALVLGLSKQTKYKTGEKPNISAIVKLALDGVTPESGTPQHGYGKTTFTKSINSALNFSENELDQ